MEKIKLAAYLQEIFHWYQPVPVPSDSQGSGQVRFHGPDPSAKKEGDALYFSFFWRRFLCLAYLSAL
jgi:hypothetical protein